MLIRTECDQQPPVPAITFSHLADLTLKPAARINRPFLQASCHLFGHKQLCNLLLDKMTLIEGFLPNTNCL